MYAGKILRFVYLSFCFLFVFSDVHSSVSLLYMSPRRLSVVGLITSMNGQFF